MKKVANVLLKIFSAGVLLALFSGALTLVGFVIAIIIGGETATHICVFIHKTLFPYIIKSTSVFVAAGLVGMYLSKIKALTLSDTSEKEQ